MRSSGMLDAAKNDNITHAANRTQFDTARSDALARFAAVRVNVLSFVMLGAEEEVQTFYSWTSFCRDFIGRVSDHTAYSKFWRLIAHNKARCKPPSLPEVSKCAAS